jgi:ATP phosphoribosyltransferase
MVAVHESQRDILINPPRRPLVIATEYCNLARDWAMQRNLAAIIVNTFGSTEGYAPEDADIVLDCVETGLTMTANGLVIVDTLLQSTTWLFANRDAYEQPEVKVWAERLTRHSVKHQ